MVNAPQNKLSLLSRATANWTHTLSTAGIMALLGILFAALYSAFIFAGPLSKFILPSVGVLLWGTAIMMFLTVLFSGFRGGVCGYSGRGSGYPQRGGYGYPD